MLFDFIIHRLDMAATKRANFKLARLAPWLVPAARAWIRTSIAVRFHTEQKLISPLGSIDRHGLLGDSRAFSGDHGTFIVNRGFAGA